MTKYIFMKYEFVVAYSHAIPDLVSGIPARVAQTAFVLSI